MLNQEYKQESFDLENQTNQDLKDVVDSGNADKVDFSSAVLSSIEQNNEALSFGELTKLGEQCKNLNCDDVKWESNYYWGKFSFSWKELSYSKHEDESREDPNLLYNGQKVSLSEFKAKLNDLKQIIGKAEYKKTEFKNNMDAGYNKANLDKVWLSLEYVNDKNVRFSMSEEKFYYQMKSKYNGSEFTSNITVQWWELRIDGFNGPFNLEEWLRVVALVNYIKKDLTDHPVNKNRMWASWKFHRSTFWDLERDIVLNPVDRDILNNKIISKYFPSIKGSNEFLNYINNIKITNNLHDEIKEDYYNSLN